MQKKVYTILFRDNLVRLETLIREAFVHRNSMQ